MTDHLAPTPPGRPEADPDPLVMLRPGVWMRRHYLTDAEAAAAQVQADAEAWTEIHNTN